MRQEQLRRVPALSPEGQQVDVDEARPEAALHDPVAAKLPLDGHEPGKKAFRGHPGLAGQGHDHVGVPGLVRWPQGGAVVHAGAGRQAHARDGPVHARGGPLQGTYSLAQVRAQADVGDDGTFTHGASGGRGANGPPLRLRLRDITPRKPRCAATGCKPDPPYSYASTRNILGGAWGCPAPPAGVKGAAPPCSRSTAWPGVTGPLRCGPCPRSWRCGSSPRLLPGSRSRCPG